MKKKNTLLYIILAGALLLGGVLGIVINLMMGHSLADMFASKWALTIYIAGGAFLTVFGILLLMEWGRK